MILSQITTTQMGDIMTVTSSPKEWLSKGVGAIRSENYDKNGDLEDVLCLPNSVSKSNIQLCIQSTL